MYKTQSLGNIKNNEKLAVNTETLAELLDCGRATATQIGTDAEAMIRSTIP